KSYSEAVQWKYRRLPGFGDIQRYDVVVFNFPNNDTVMLERPADDYYQLVRALGRQQVWANYTIITRPVDKKENYIKRCVGIPGDTIALKGGLLHVNGKPAPVFPHQRTEYILEGNTSLNPQFIEEHNIQINEHPTAQGRVITFDMEAETAEQVAAIPGITAV